MYSYLDGRLRNLPYQFSVQILTYLIIFQIINQIPVQITGLFFFHLNQVPIKTTNLFFFHLNHVLVKTANLFFI